MTVKNRTPSGVVDVLRLLVVAFFAGCILTALGVIAEYLAVTMSIVMGKPLYVVGSKPTRPAVPK